MTVHYLYLCTYVIVSGCIPCILQPNDTDEGQTETQLVKFEF